MAGLCEGGNEPPSSLKTIFLVLIIEFVAEMIVDNDFADLMKCSVDCATQIANRRNRKEGKFNPQSKDHSKSGTWFRERHCDDTPLAGQIQIQMERSLTPVSERLEVVGGRKQEMNSYQCEPRCAPENRSTRRVDILAYNADTKQGIIVDPTISFEVECHQSAEVHLEKESIYEPTVNYFKLKYALIHVEVFGLLKGARVTIPAFSKNFDGSLLCQHL
ncbi:hypothetical protein ANN_02015 [Periplaneta americana]|uniref:Uncharacterized protein n=1 Tax=Periplaneta americana TaxID=6978 RepID=A0ABQ8TY60_PERAM|nr:hypothetical protein ANN_02015 [Periplaneta americana]